MSRGGQHVGVFPLSLTPGPTAQPARFPGPIALGAETMPAVKGL